MIAVVRRDCPTCRLVEPVLFELVEAGHVAVYSQDDPSFPDSIHRVGDDSSLELSTLLRIETVPTLVRLSLGVEVSRAEGWRRSAWEELTGVDGLGPDLPEHRPGCASTTRGS